MSKYLGDYAEDATVDFMFHTVSFTTGAPASLSSGVVQVYKGNGTGQVSTGVTLSADFDGITGQHHVRIDLSDSFYATANDYNVVLSGGTVGGVSVAGTVLATFSIENRNVKADLRKIDGTALSSATLNLKKLNVVNSTGDAVVMQSTGSNGHGLTVQGHGTGAGVLASGGDTNGHGAYVIGHGTGNGIYALCDIGTGDGLHLQGGDDGGFGLHATSPTEATDVDFKLGPDALEAVSATALARWVTVNTGQTDAASGSVADLSGGAGGGGGGDATLANQNTIIELLQTKSG